MMQSNLFWFVPVAAVLALSFAWYFFRTMMKESEGTDTMKKIASHVRKGAMAYIKQQYKVVGIFFLVLTTVFSILAYGLNLQNDWVPFAFLTGGFFSGLAGFFGMKTATFASARTANAAQKSLNSGLRVAFRSGAVMGLVVVGLGLLDISLWFILLNHFIDVEPGEKLAIITTTMLTFGMGASTQALFARVGGGIFTKAADVGADLVGKVEAGIPEDDPRNPATIADNVGDNVGDVAGMGADLYGSRPAIQGCAGPDDDRRGGDHSFHPWDIPGAYQGRRNPEKPAECPRKGDQYKLSADRYPFMGGPLHA
jgi:K(+)-stimulated pyrophosphate-energized sodium pump